MLEEDSGLFRMAVWLDPFIVSRSLSSLFNCHELFWIDSLL
jgi:hypothetical protein